jgi:hypothetical protein
VQIGKCAGTAAAGPKIIHQLLLNGNQQQNMYITSLKTCVLFHMFSCTFSQLHRGRVMMPKNVKKNMLKIRLQNAKMQK